MVYKGRQLECDMNCPFVKEELCHPKAWERANSLCERRVENEKVEDVMKELMGVRNES